MDTWTKVWKINMTDVYKHTVIVPLAETSTVTKAPVRRRKMAVVLLDVAAVVLAALVVVEIVTAVLTERGCPINYNMA